MSDSILGPLDELRRQIEEDYIMDMTAIKHLSRHFRGASETAPAPAFMPVPYGSHQSPSMVKAAPPAREPQPDDLNSSFRAMFAYYR